MDPMTLGLLLNAGGLVASQMGGNRPGYEIPDSAKQALGQAGLLAYDQAAPGEPRRMDAARLSSANAVRAAQEGGNALETVAGIQGQENAAVQGILADSEVSQRQDMNTYMDLLLRMGEKEDLKFQMNEFAPYADKQNELRDILGAATQNAYNLSEKERLLKLIGGESGGTTIAPQSVTRPDYGNTFDDKLGPMSMGGGTDTRGGGEWSKNITDGSDLMSLLELLQKNLGKINLLP